MVKEMITLYLDKKGYYHENPSITLEYEKVKVNNNVFRNLVQQGKVYRE